MSNILHANYCQSLTINARKYDEFGRTYLFDVDGHHIKEWARYMGKKNWKITYCIDAYHAGNVCSYFALLTSQVLNLIFSLQFTRYLVGNVHSGAADRLLTLVTEPQL